MQSPVCLVDKIETALRDVAKVALRGALIALRSALRAALRGR